MKNILIVTYIFPPMAGGGVQRTLKFIKYLPAYGWKPMVLTIKPYEWPIVDYDLNQEIPEVAEVYKCFSLEERRTRGLFKKLLNFKPFEILRRYLLEVPDHCIGWLPFALGQAKQIIKKNKIDIIYSTFPPATSHLIGYFLKKQYDIPWVTDFRDPWLDHPFYHTNNKTVFYKKIDKEIERLVINSSDLIITTTHTYKNDILNKYSSVKTNKVGIITNGYDEEDFHKKDVKKKSNQFTLTYTGFVGENVNLEIFFKACKKLANKHPVEIKKWKINFIGRSDKQVRKFICKYKLEQIIKSVGYILHQESICNISNADVLLIFSRGRNILPAKIFEYLRAKRPILAFSEEDDELSSLIKNLNAGVVVSSKESNQIAGVLWDLYINREKNRGIYQISDNILKNYERKQLTLKLSNVLKDLINKQIKD